MIEINGEKTENVRVRVSPLVVFAKIAEKILAANDLPREVYVTDNGKIAYDTTYHTSHSWDETTILEDITYHKASIVKALELIRDQIREHNI